MDLEETVSALLSENQRLEKEIDRCRLMLSVAQENRDLKAKLQSLGNSECTVPSCSGGNQSCFGQTTVDERQFRESLQKTRQEQRSSSPTDFRCFIQTSMCRDSSEETDSEDMANFSLDPKDQKRLLGEVAYQLDKRIKCHVFQGQKRFYGFTLLNISEKILEVSSQPFTGKVDEGYRHYLTQRHAKLMEMLSQLGYRAALHPQFAEFIVNTFGILKEEPDKNNTRAVDCNNPDYLKKVVLTAAPRKLQKDLLILLTCLCTMAEWDGKPLLN